MAPYVACRIDGDGLSNGSGLTAETGASPGSVRRLAAAMARRKITIRPPGLKPTTKVGTLGPYRGRLGLAWVIAPVVVGVLILVAGYLALTR